PEQGADVAFFLGVGDGLLHIAVHFGEAGQVVFQEGPRLPHRDPQVLREAEGTLAVHDAKVDGLGRRAQPGGDLRQGDAVDLGGGAAVDVLPAAEGRLHVLVPGDVGQDAQLDLAVVGVHKDAARLCDEEAPQLAAQLGADGDVLQVGVVRGEAAGAGLGPVEGGVNPPVGADHLQQAFGVGGVQLEVGAVLQDVVHQGAVGPQLLQGGVVGGPAPAGLAAVGQL